MIKGDFMAEKIFIEVNNLEHTYNQGMNDEFKALQKINLQVKEGEFLAVLGTNGSGKSTLAKHLNGLLQPTSGTCRIDGMLTSDPEKIWDIRQRVGMVFQNPDNQLIAAVVEDDVAFGPENMGFPPSKIKRLVIEALKAVGMIKKRKFAPHLLSGGQKQRVAIAGALAMQTKCLVLDEPTAMLDPAGRQEVLLTLKKLHKEQGLTVVYITHYMEEAAEADRIIVMDKGQISHEGTPAEIFAHVPEMKKMGLTVPLAAEISWRLKAAGVKLPEGIIKREDLVNALCRLN